MWAEDSNVRQVKSVALNLQPFQLTSHLLQAMNNIFHLNTYYVIVDMTKNRNFYVFKKYTNAVLKLCDDIYHDILKREEGEARPMTKYSRVEAPGYKSIFLSHIGNQDVS